MMTATLLIQYALFMQQPIVHDPNDTTTSFESRIFIELLFPSLSRIFHFPIVSIYFLQLGFQCFFALVRVGLSLPHVSSCTS